MPVGGKSTDNLSHNFTATPAAGESIRNVPVSQSIENGTRDIYQSPAHPEISDHLDWTGTVLRNLDVAGEDRQRDFKLP